MNHNEPERDIRGVNTTVDAYAIARKGRERGIRKQPALL